TSATAARATKPHCMRGVATNNNCPPAPVHTLVSAPLALPAFALVGSVIELPLHNCANSPAKDHGGRQDDPPIADRNFRPDTEQNIERTYNSSEHCPSDDATASRVRIRLVE